MHAGIHHPSPWADPPPLGRQPPPLPVVRHRPLARPPGQTHPPADGYCCGRYASYWNAFLLLNIFGLPHLFPTHIDVETDQHEANFIYLRNITFSHIFSGDGNEMETCQHWNQFRSEPIEIFQFYITHDSKIRILRCGPRHGNLQGLSYAIQDSRILDSRILTSTVHNSVVFNKFTRK